MENYVVFKIGCCDYRKMTTKLVTDGRTTMVERGIGSLRNIKRNIRLRKELVRMWQVKSRVSQ